MTDQLQLSLACSNRHPLRFAAIVLLTLQFALLKSVTAQQPAEKTTLDSALSWHTSLEDAVAESKRTGKPILMEVHGRPWCPPCVLQGKRVIAHPDFVDWGRDKFVLLEIQVGDGYSKSKGSPIWAEQFKKYQLPGIPAVILLDAEQQMMGTIYPKDDVSQWLGAANNILTTHAVRRQNLESIGREVIPFWMTPENNISVPAVLDGRIALNMMFHTGVESVSLTAATTSLYPSIILDGQVESESWGGRSKTRFGKSRIAIGPLPTEEVTIFEDVHSGTGTDGKFGPEQLQSQTFLVDFERSEIQLHSAVPAEIVDSTDEWKKLELRSESGMMFISGKLFSGGQSVSSSFMLHSGYGGYGLLSGKLVSEEPFLRKLDVQRQDSLLDASGNRLTTKLVRVPELEVGEERMQDVPFSFFDGALGNKQFNILGVDFLRRFNWCFDLDEGCVFMKKNANYDIDHFTVSREE